MTAPILIDLEVIKERGSYYLFKFWAELYIRYNDITSDIKQRRHYMLSRQCFKLMESNTIFDLKYSVVVNAYYMYFQALLERP